MRVRVTAEDQGRIITCRANNGLGASVATNITLDVLRECVSLACPVVSPWGGAGARPESAFL